MQQLLFDNPKAGPLSRSTDPPGSYVAAAHLAASGLYKTQCEVVHAALRLQRRPVTSKRLAALMHADRHMVARRLADLERSASAEKHRDEHGTLVKEAGTGEAMWNATETV